MAVDRRLSSVVKRPKRLAAEYRQRKWPDSASQKVDISVTAVSETEHTQRLGYMIESNLASKAAQGVKPQIFDELYLTFWKNEFEDARIGRERDLILHLAELQKGDKVLDLGCGIGRLSIALANEGLEVVGVDRSDDAFVEASRIPIRGCRFIKSDWRNILPTAEFNCVLFWFTTLCTDFDTDMVALEIARSSLAEGGTLLIETRHWDRMERRFDPTTIRCSEKGKLVEHHSYDPVSGQQTTDEVFEIGPARFQRTYTTRRYCFSQLRDMCLHAGFRHVDGFDENGRVLGNESERAVLRARFQ